jgi:phage RecT family recombinase
MSKLTIIDANPDNRLLALHSTRLKELVTDPNIFNAICIAAVHLLSNERLRECTQESILGGLYKAVTLNCRLDPVFGECYLIPRKVGGVQVASFQLGYKYWKAKALESGHLKFLQSKEVYREDEFSYEFGSKAFLTHKPAEKTDGETVFFYAWAELNTGGHIFEVITKQAAEKSRQNSETQYSGYGRDKVYSQKPVGIWAQHYAPMALRVPIKRLAMSLPMTELMETALQADGSVTYVQNDGQVVTMSPNDVENQAEQVEHQEVLPDSFVEALQDDIQILEGYELPQILAYWKDKSTTEHGKHWQFAAAFTEDYCTKAKTVDELSQMWAALKKWTTNDNIKAIFTTNRKRIENAAKDGQ